MERQIINLDIFISALIHDLGKVSSEYYLSKNSNSKQKDIHAHILIDRYPKIISILDKPTKWAPSITYLDIMTKHHEPYTSNPVINLFKVADRKDRELTFSMIPIQTRITNLEQLITMDYLGNKSYTMVNDIPYLQKLIVDHLKYLLSEEHTSIIKVINEIYRPILTNFPTDNRPGAANPIWDHATSIYIYLKNLNPSHPLLTLSHPESKLFHPYGSLSIFFEILPYLNKLISASANHILREQIELAKSIGKHLSNLKEKNYEVHRLTFIRKNVKLLKNIARPIPSKTLNDILINIFGISRPPSIRKYAQKLITNYLYLRYKLGYTHNGALFHLFYRRKMTISDLIHVLRNQSRGPYDIWTSQPQDKVKTWDCPTTYPPQWAFSSRNNGMKIRPNLYIKDIPQHVLVNASKIFNKRIHPKCWNLTIDR